MLKKIINSPTSYMKSIVLALGCVITATNVCAQSNSDRSPYSRFGYGIHSAPTTAGSRAMGGIAYGLRDGLIINPSNPASYTTVDSMTFIMDIGLSARYSTLSTSGRSDTRLLGNLDYIALIFPVSKQMGISAGMMPLTKMGYSFGTTDTMGGDSNTTEYNRLHRGSGGYNNIYIGIARDFWGLHFGVNGSLILGQTTRTSQSTFATTGAYNPIETHRLRLSGLKIDLGAQYEFKLDSTQTRSLVLGVALTPQHYLGSELYHTRQGVSSTGNIEVLLNDTIKSSSAYSMPLSIGTGLSYRIADKLMIGADVKYSKWSEADFQQLEATFRDQWTVALGMEWTPDSRARSPWQRAKYRFGLSGGNSYLSVPISATSVSGYYELGASLGISFPLVDRRSVLNVSLDYKHLRPQSSGMIHERYIGATVGIVFNEGWFRKARVN